MAELAQALFQREQLVARAPMAQRRCQRLRLFGQLRAALQQGGQCIA